MNEAGAGEPPDAVREPFRRRDAAWMLPAAVLVALLAHGYARELGAENQPLQIPVIEQLKDPALYPNDPLVDALAEQQSVFFPAVAVLGRWFPTEHQFLVLHLLTTAAAAAAMASLTGLLAGSRTAAIVAALLLLVSPILRPTPLGRDTMVAAWVTPTTVSFPVLLVALRFLLSGRAGLAGVLAGLAANLNLVMAGLWAIVALPVALGDTRGARSAARLAAGFGLAALPALLALPDEAWIRGRGLDFVLLVRRYYPYHFFLGVQPPGMFLRFAILVAAAVAGFRALPASEAKGRARRMAIAVGVAIAIGSFFADVVPIAAVIQLHLLRVDRWFCVLLLAAAGATAPRAMASRGRWDLAGALALVAGLARGAYPLIAWGALVLFMLPWARNGQPRLLLLLAPAAGALVAMDRLWEPGHHASAVLMLLLLLIVLLPAARFATTARRARRTRQWALGTVIAIALLELSLGNGTLGSRGIALARPVLDRDWREVQEWAAMATPKNAKFLTPPETLGFRVYARRSAVVEWKDGAAMLWDPDFGAGWSERQAAVTEAIASQNAAKLLATARRYGAGWLVLPAESAPQELTPVHENLSFKLFAIDGDREP